VLRVAVRLMAMQLEKEGKLDEEESERPTSALHRTSPASPTWLGRFWGGTKLEECSWLFSLPLVSPPLPFSAGAETSVPCVPHVPGRPRKCPGDVPVGSFPRFQSLPGIAGDSIRVSRANELVQVRSSQSRSESRELTSRSRSYFFFPFTLSTNQPHKGWLVAE
jgi:hypothetical protein